MTATQTTGAPAGFRDVQAEESTGVRVDKEALSSGVVVRYKGSRRFPRKDSSMTTVQIFVARGGKGARFSTFGTAQLDSKLRSVAKDSIIWIRYGGKKAIDGNETHDWQVSDAGVRLDDAKIADLSRNSDREHNALDAVIATAEREQAARRQAGQTAPDYDEREFSDDEVPA